MLTKKDLEAIRTIVDSSIGSVITSSEGKLRAEIHASSSGLFSILKREMDKNTQELVELITTGFHISDDHETRLTLIEKKVFHNAI